MLLAQALNQLRIKRGLQFYNRADLYKHSIQL